VCVRGGT